MNRVYIAWTPENMITVILMAALGYGLFALGWQAFTKFTGKSYA